MSRQNKRKRLNDLADGLFQDGAVWPSDEVDEICMTTAARDKLRATRGNYFRKRFLPRKFYLIIERIWGDVFLGPEATLGNQYPCHWGDKKDE